ncbi:MAG: helix-turn-helix transcriptional regulator [Saprospiraceae bacterium]|nr:helix-turn-helix transcriptional regulator [Saprospiraceae bacterium]
MIENSVHLKLIETGKVQSSAFQAKILYKVFCLQGKGIFGFGPIYRRELQAGKVFLIYNPEEALNYQLDSEADSKIIILGLPLTELHKMFVPESIDAPVFHPDNINRKYYEEKNISPEIHQILQGLYQNQMPTNAQRLYLQAKAMETLSLFYSGRNQERENCPFLNDEQMVRKLKQVKETLIASYQSAPTLTELARQTGLNENQLKVGFREIYGMPPYQYLLNHRLDIARNMLLSGKHQVNEVADHIGYQNVSHFISAFKKKFGLTPKKMMA